MTERQRRQATSGRRAVGHGSAGHALETSPTPAASGGATTPLLAVRGIHKSFPGVHALRGVDLDCHAGRVHALVGENGAGKSTLVSVLTGIRQPDDGELTWLGEPLRLPSPRVALLRGISAVYQELTVLPDLSVADNVLLGQELSRRGVLDRKAAHRRVTELLAQVGLAAVPPQTRSARLSVAQRQLVEIARALARDARVLILDEPTAVLGDDDIDRLFAVVRELTARGVAVVYISHRLPELDVVADDVTVLRDGEVVSTGQVGDYGAGRLVQDMVGRDVDAARHHVPPPRGETVLDVRGLLLPGTEPDGISFQVRAGEIVGLAGLVGSGRSRLLRALVGLTPALDGRVYVIGRPLPRRTVRRAARAGIAYLPEERKTEGLVLDLPVAANITLPVLRRVTRAGLVLRRREHRTAADAARRLGLRAAGMWQVARELSGGNQQKTVLAKWLEIQPKVLLLDEPTRGVDVGGKAEIHRIVQTLSADGLATVVASSDLPELLGLVHRVLVLRGGRVAGELSRAEASEEAVVALAMGGDTRESRPGGR